MKTSVISSFYNLFFFLKRPSIFGNILHIEIENGNIHTYVCMLEEIPEYTYTKYMCIVSMITKNKHKCQKNNENRKKLY